MPFGAFINQLPPVFFMIVHLVAFIIAVIFSIRTFEANLPRLGWAFILYAIAELVYMTYHLDWTVFLFAHTIAEVLDLVSFILVFVSAVQVVMHRRITTTTSSHQA